MAKLTQFGRMRRRIKKELEAARAERGRVNDEQALGLIASKATMDAAMNHIQMIRSAVVTAKMLAAWKKEKLCEGECHEDLERKIDHEKRRGANQAADGSKPGRDG